MAYRITNTELCTQFFITRYFYGCVYNFIKIKCLNENQEEYLSFVINKKREFEWTNLFVCKVLFVFIPKITLYTMCSYKLSQETLLKEDLKWALGKKKKEWLMLY